MMMEFAIEASPSRTALTVAAASANFNWQEIGVFNSVALGSGTMFNRFLSAIGTKPNTQTWQLTVTITVQAA